MTNKRAAGAALGLAAVLCATGVAAAPAQAQGGGRVVQKSGSCTGGGVWKLKAKADNTRISVEFEVDINRAGKTFTVGIKDNGVRVFLGHATTVAPSGSFTVHRLIANRAGTDVIHAHAVRGSRDCAGTVRF